MQPILFGPSVEPLYGVMETPTARPRKAAVLLLYPGIQEYLRAHRAFHSLAATLAADGFYVLRFDYRGVGDSAGDPDSTTFEACVEDACVAAREIREAGNAQRVTIIGMRLGAAIGMHASEELPFVNRVFLWNPVVDGRAYLRELEHMDGAMRLRLLHPLRRPEDELAGFRFPSAVRRSVERVDLCDRAAPSGRGVEIFSGADSPEGTALREALSRRGHTVTTHVIRNGAMLAAFPDASLLAQEAISALASRMDEVES